MINQGALDVFRGLDYSIPTPHPAQEYLRRPSPPRGEGNIAQLQLFARCRLFLGRQPRQIAHNLQHEPIRQPFVAGLIVADQHLRQL